MPTFTRTILPVLLLVPALLIVACSGEGPQVTDPDAKERNETIFLTTGEATSELVRYREATSSAVTGEFQTANGAALGIGVDFLRERYDRLWMVDATTGAIVVASVADRMEIGRINDLPSGPDSAINGLAFSNLSQAWGIAYGAEAVILIDALNVVAVRTIGLPGKPTAIATTDNRVFIGLEMPNGSGAIALIRSNDPDLEVSTITTVRRPPIHLMVNDDEIHIVGILPGEDADIAGTPEVDTDPSLVVLDLASLETVFNGRFISPNLQEHVGATPVYAADAQDFFIFIATNEGVKRVDTKSWGRSVNVTNDGTPYRMVAADFFSELIYAVPSGSPAQIDRFTGTFSRLSPLTMGGPVSAMTFVGTGRVTTP